MFISILERNFYEKIYCDFHSSNDVTDSRNLFLEKGTNSEEITNNMESGSR